MIAKNRTLRTRERRRDYHFRSDLRRIRSLVIDTTAVIIHRIINGLTNSFSSRLMRRVRSTGISSRYPLFRAVWLRRLNGPRRRKGREEGAEQTGRILLEKKETPFSRRTPSRPSLSDGRRGPPAPTPPEGAAINNVLSILPAWPR